MQRRVAHSLSCKQSLVRKTPVTPKYNGELMEHEMLFSDLACHFCMYNSSWIDKAGGYSPFTTTKVLSVHLVKIMSLCYIYNIANVRGTGVQVNRWNCSCVFPLMSDEKSTPKMQIKHRTINESTNWCIKDSSLESEKRRQGYLQLFIGNRSSRQTSHSETVQHLSGYLPCKSQRAQSKPFGD